MIKVGDTFKLNCGVYVRVVEYINRTHVVVEDDRGNTRVIKSGNLRSGNVSWVWKAKTRALEVGQRFTLNCGVTVSVKEIYSGGMVLVEDSNRNSATVRVDRLKVGEILWRVAGVSARAVDMFRDYPVWSQHESKFYGSFTILDHDSEAETSVVRWNETKHIQRGVCWRKVHNKTLRDESISVSQKDMTAPNAHYVYVAESDGKCYYVGSGKGLRYRHVNSGISHNYRLNMHHFSIGPLAVRIAAEGLTKEQSLELEREMIEQLAPEYNIN